jgi:hypothetical protein
MIIFGSGVIDSDIALIAIGVGVRVVDLVIDQVSVERLRIKRRVENRQGGGAE